MLLSFFIDPHAGHCSISNTLCSHFEVILFLFRECVTFFFGTANTIKPGRNILGSRLIIRLQKFSKNSKHPLFKRATPAILSLLLRELYEIRFYNLPTLPTRVSEILQCLILKLKLQYLQSESAMLGEGIQF